MAERIVPREQLLYASYSPPHVYEDGTDDGQPLVTALFQELADSGEVGYAIREYSLAKGEIFYRFPKRRGGHWSRAVIRQWPDPVFCTRCYESVSTDSSSSSLPPASSTFLSSSTAATNSAGVW
jgi:hypothetical protein